MSVFNYLQLPQPELVPSYSPPDTRLLANSTNNLIQQQEQGRQQVELQRDVFNEQRLKASALPEVDRESYLNTINEQEQRLNSIVESQGLRGARNTIGQIARDFQTSLHPYQAGIQRMTNAMGRIDSSEADGTTKAFGRQLVQKAAEGGIKDFNVPEILNTLESWRDLRSEVIDLSKRWGTSSEAISSIQGDEHGRYIMRALAEVGRPDEFKAAALIQLLNDRHANNQLRLLAMERYGTTEVTPEQIRNEALNLIEPEYINKKAQKLSFVERINADYMNYQQQWNPTMLLGTQDENEDIKSFSNIMEANKGVAGALMSIDNKYEEALKNYEEQGFKYNIQEQVDGSRILLDEQGRRVWSPTIEGLNVQRYGIQQQQRERQELLDNAVRYATNGEFTSAEQLMSSDTFLEDFERAKNRIAGGETARRGDPLTRLFASNQESFSEEEIENRALEQLLSQRAGGINNSQIRKINEWLKENSAAVERAVAPMQLPRNARESLENNWRTILRTNNLIDNRGAPINDEKIKSTIGEEADFRGVIHTPEGGFELVFHPKPSEDRDYQGVVRVRIQPGSSIMNDLATFGGIDTVSFGVMNSLQQINASPARRGVIPLIDERVENSPMTHDLSVQAIREDGALRYRVLIPPSLADEIDESRSARGLPLTSRFITANNEDELITRVVALQKDLAEQAKSR
jgi:hypothetical protein